MKNKFSIKTFKNQVLLGFCALLTVASVFVTINAATMGSEMSRLEKKEIALVNEKRSLQESLVKTLSSKELEEKSSSLGFVKPSNIVYISDFSSVANLP